MVRKIEEILLFGVLRSNYTMPMKINRYAIIHVVNIQLYVSCFRAVSSFLIPDILQPAVVYVYVSV